MKRTPLYSQSRPTPRPPAAGAAPAAQADPPPGGETAAAQASAAGQAVRSGPTGKAPPPLQADPTAKARPSRVRRFLARHPRPLWAFAAVALVFAGMAGQQLLTTPHQVLTQEDIDKAVRHTLTEGPPLPSAYTCAYLAVRPSVVRVVGLDEDDKVPKADGADDPKEHKRSTGTGFVIIDNGTILTNLHVVAGAKRIRVTFHDGHQSDATVVNTQPENDLAVLRARSIPDDLQAATMRGTADLLPGDQVLAVGFPFGIGPSSSGGIVSGLKRQFRSPEGERLSNLIQFDAAANPGNSGGPLVTMDGAVVGVVTAILNPGDAGTFVGIGFAVPIENAAAAAGMPPF